MIRPCDRPDLPGHGDAGTTCQAPRPVDGSVTRQIVVGTDGDRFPAGTDGRLTRFGWTILTADGADAARALARTARPATVVLSAEDGMLACAKLVRELPRTRVVVVGPADDRVERYARFAGAAEYLTETATPEQFLGAVTDGLGIAC